MDRMAETFEMNEEHRAKLIELAARGKLTVPIAQTFPLSDAPRAVEALRGSHPYGKLALVA